jgi:hypothetical protein
LKDEIPPEIEAEIRFDEELHEAAAEEEREFWRKDEEGRALRIMERLRLAD